MEHLIFWLSFTAWIPLCATFAGLLCTRELQAKRHREALARIVAAEPDTRPLTRSGRNPDGLPILPWNLATWSAI
jgi:hypothetical protein